MPSLVEGDDRQTVKRTVPKASNKIHAVAVVKLYVAYPDRQRWTFTGLQGAACLANDLVGNTYWIKLVDISPANRGVIWDQEIYDTLAYNQDRVFFHSFELESCMAGFSFADDKEAKKFKQKMDEREKNAHKNTKSKPFGNSSGQAADSNTTNGKSHGILGGFGSLLGGHRHSSASQQQPAQSIIPPKEISVTTSSNQNGAAKDPTLGNIDPALLDELLTMGITEDQLADNADFIKMWIEKKNATSKPDTETRQPSVPQSLSPDHTGSGRRGPPPAPPPARRGQKSDAPASISPVRTEESPPPPATGRRQFRAPPPLADAGKFAQEAKAAPKAAPLQSRPRGASRAAHPGPPPPPRPPKTPLQEDERHSPRFGVPTSFEIDRSVPPPPPARSQGPPAPPARGPVPPPPPARDSAPVHHVPPAIMGALPPLPPKTPNAHATHSSVPPPLPPGRDNQTPSHAPALPPVTPSREPRAFPPPPPTPQSHATGSLAPAPRLPVLSSSGPPPPPPMPSSSGPPPPPPMPSFSGPPPPPPMPSNSGPPPPPPILSGSGPPPPPPMPSREPGMEPATAHAPPLPPAGEGVRGGLLSDIRGGARLKKVSNAEKKDRSAAVVGSGGSGGAAPAGGNPAPAGGGDSGGLAGALASALAARKSKVSASDDEDDKDDW